MIDIVVAVTSFSFLVLKVYGFSKAIEEEVLGSNSLGALISGVVVDFLNLRVHMGAEHQCSYYITVNPFIGLVGWLVDSLFVWFFVYLFVCLG